MELDQKRARSLCQVLVDHGLEQLVLTAFDIDLHASDFLNIQFGECAFDVDHLDIDSWPLPAKDTGAVASQVNLISTATSGKPCRDDPHAIVSPKAILQQMVKFWNRFEDD